MTTQKQKQARIRNHLILRLRGAYSLFHTLNSKEGMTAVDDELEKLGAVRETYKRANTELLLTLKR